METIEKTILKNLILNEDYTRKVLPFIKKDYFDSVHEKVIFEESERFISEYNKCPTVEILNIECEKRSDINQETFQTVVSAFFRNLILIVQTKSG